ncbi:hypothetical protein BD410DRAFT_827199 [Rickenella mellea]|uniref:Uncharacterized protein n=1 Tax=Rickenella mellea TaxID=50990 RepID=A0A4Y7QA62_9AGAM|nr:hypothetical protein BD410DRAFT_827199 [Rickenella mellea]
MLKSLRSKSSGSSLKIGADKPNECSPSKGFARPRRPTFTSTKRTPTPSVPLRNVALENLKRSNSKRDGVNRVDDFGRVKAYRGGQALETQSCSMIGSQPSTRIRLPTTRSVNARTFPSNKPFDRTVHAAPQTYEPTSDSEDEEDDPFHYDSHSYCASSSTSSSGHTSEPKATTCEYEELHFKFLRDIPSTSHEHLPITPKGDETFEYDEQCFEFPKPPCTGQTYRQEINPEARGHNSNASFSLPTYKAYPGQRSPEATQVSPPPDKPAKAVKGKKGMEMWSPVTPKFIGGFNMKARRMKSVPNLTALPFRPGTRGRAREDAASP